MTTKVSVITPVYNNASGLTQLLPALLVQDYPAENYEIIVADNGSSDDTLTIAEQFADKYPNRMKYVVEDNIQSSYAARNRAIEVAKGTILAFTDSDCLPAPQWLSEGVKKLEESGADLAGGKVEFSYSERQSSAELYDSITSMQVQSNIEDRDVAKTANLFVKADLFDKIGHFPAQAVSGGDVIWTAKATRNGFSLVYAPEAVVTHPARALPELLKKQSRVGKGKVSIWHQQKKSHFSILLLTLKPLLPPKPWFLKKIIRSRVPQETNYSFISIWSIAYLCRCATFFGILSNLFTQPSTEQESNEVN